MGLLKIDQENSIQTRWGMLRVSAEIFPNEFTEIINLANRFIDKIPLKKLTDTSSSFTKPVNLIPEIKTLSQVMY